MKLVQILFSGLGGHGSVAFSLVRGDRERTFDHGMVFYGVEDLASGYAEACSELGVTYELIHKRPGLDLGSWKAVVGALEKSAPDVIVLHSMPLLGAVAAFGRATRTPIVAVDHLSVHMKRRREWALTLASQVLADRTVVLSREFADELREKMRLLYRAERIEVIPNGIDVETFSPGEAYARADGVLRIGMHGRFSASKDHATLLRAAAKLEHVKVVLAGDGETMPATRALVGELAIEDRVEILGMLPEVALPAYLRSLDIYVQSSFGEAMSTAVMQAMATGLPVVASDVGGLRNMICPGQTGELFPYGDANALARILSRLGEEVDVRERYGRAARQHAVEHWSQYAMFERYAALIAALVDDATSRKTSA